MFLDPGGPGDTGVGLIRGGGDDIDKWGDGRFDLIAWDPRGTHASSPVKCFASDADAATFWDGVALPSTPEESTAYAARMKDLAQRCGEAMGPLLSHISTTDTVRDLDRLRELNGDETITYAGLSYGTMIGQMYANMYPDRVRAMMLEGVVYPPDYVTSAETRSTNDAAGTDQVFNQFLTLCDQAGPDKCALAGHGEPAAARVARLFAQVKAAPIPAPNASPPDELHYSDLQLTSFPAMRDPHLWPQYAAELNAAVDGDVTALVTAAQESRSPAAFDEATKSSAISCLDGPASKTVDDWPTVIGNLDASSVMSGSVQGWWLWAPCAANWPASSDDRYTGPWDTKTKEPILLIGNRYDPNTAYRNAVRSQLLLGNAVLLTNQGYGHLSFNNPSACIEAGPDQPIWSTFRCPYPAPCARPTSSRSTSRHEQGHPLSSRPDHRGDSAGSRRRCLHEHQPDRHRGDRRNADGQQSRPLPPPSNRARSWSSRSTTPRSSPETTGRTTSSTNSWSSTCISTRSP